MDDGLGRTARNARTVIYALDSRVVSFLGMKNIMSPNGSVSR